jgi:hypothetical protein
MSGQNNLPTAAEMNADSAAHDTADAKVIAATAIVERNTHLIDIAGKLLAAVESVIPGAASMMAGPLAGAVAETAIAAINAAAKRR